MKSQESKDGKWQHVYMLMGIIQEREEERN